MSELVFANNATSTLAGAITNTSTSVSLQTGEGALFPSPTAGEYFVGSFVDAATGLLTEIVWCTARSGDVLTIVRAQESTSALPWNPGDFFSNLWTAGQAAEMLQQGQVPGSITYYGTDTGSANAIVATMAPALSALATGDLLEITVLHANTNSTVTLNASAVGAHNVYRVDGSALAIGDIQASPYAGLFSWNGNTNQFLLLNPCTWASNNTTPTVETSGSGTYTTPAGCVRLVIEMVGGGSGGGGAGTTTSGGSGQAGGNTSFGGLTCAGGVATPASSGSSYPSPAAASGGDINVSGSLGGPGSQFTFNPASESTWTLFGGAGAGTYFGSGSPGGAAPPSISGVTITPVTATSPGSGGGGGTMLENSAVAGFSGWGGNAGAYLRKTITSPSASYSYSVGSGGTAGTAGTSGCAGSSGANGLIIITPYFV